MASESPAVKDVTVISGSVVGGSEARDLRPYSADSNPSRRLDAASGRFELRFADGELAWTDPAPETPVRWLRAHDSEDSRSVVAGYSRAQLGGSKPDFLSLIRLIDPRVSSLELLSPDDFVPELFAASEGTGPMPLSQFGDGLWQGLRVATAVAADRGGVVLVDEFDSALHYSALLDVSRWWIEAARRFDVQLFLTTHSLEALDALLASVEGRPEDLVVFRLDKTESGVVARRFDEPTLRDLRVEGGLELR